MKKPILFLLAPGFEGKGFEDNGRREYCPECAEIWGVLSYFPAIKEAVNIIYQPISRPRAEMVEMIGEDAQNCPTLILPRGTPIPNGVRIKTSNTHTYLDSARSIAIYFAKLYGIPFPR